MTSEEICISCKKSVAPGSGLYVNRVPVSAEGFLCAECQADPCDRCGVDVIDSHTLEHDDGEVEHVCDDCLTPAELEELGYGD